MIDMSKLYEHNDYQAALDSFKSSGSDSNCNWRCFRNIQKELSNNRCPICECLLDESVTRLSNAGNNIPIIPTIDHYRPQTFYPFLKCDHENYLLMCSECNRMYKGHKFPLYRSGTRAINKLELQNEQPLIVNPLYDDLLELFVLVFKRSSSRGQNILEIQPKSDVPSSYFYVKAMETIKVFGLGDCEINRHQNDNVHNCRISILEEHFNIFYEFAKALKTGDNHKINLELQENGNLFKSYGFSNFLKNPDNFEIHI